MKTQIFKDYSEFYKREDKSINGVSEYFAKENPNYEKENETNDGCWNCSDCYRCSDCYDCSDCYRCSDCYDCSDCSRCSRCSRCSDCSNWKNNEPPIKMGEYPKIENIHQKVYEAITKEGCALKMDSWHSDDTIDEKGGYCGTTHCRAGWVVALAGAEGRKLELHTNTAFAAMMIYKASSPIRISPVRFHESDEIAMADIKKCAELEQAK